MEERKNKRGRPAGFGPCGQLRRQIAAIPVFGHVTITVQGAGAKDKRQLNSWISGVSGRLKKAGVRFSRLSIDDGFYITRNA